MQGIYSNAEIRKIEKAFWLANPDISLMDYAGLAAAEKARQMMANGSRVLIICGPGNNGGDGLVAARHLQKWGYHVTVVLQADVSNLPSEALKAFENAKKANLSILDSIPAANQWDLIIDALFGIGITRPINEPFSKSINWINQQLNTPILSLDVPSGLDSDKGIVHNIAVRATETITFIGLKPGLFTSNGKDYAGLVTLACLDIKVEEYVKPQGYLLEKEIATYLPPRLANSHKGTYGSLGIIGGAIGMLGAVSLAGRAALKTGAGKVHIGSLAKNPVGYDFLQPELMWHDAEDLLQVENINAIAIGPGLGQSELAYYLLNKCLTKSTHLLLDADALNVIAANESLQSVLIKRQAPTVLTPHPSEAARLLRCTTKEIQENRIDAACQLAEKFNAYVALKGSGTICAQPSGAYFINSSGNAGLASGGTGDVLTGAIGAFIAQGLEPLKAMLIGVFMHGWAADTLVNQGIGPTGMIASDIIDEMRSLLNANSMNIDKE